MKKIGNYEINLDKTLGRGAYAKVYLCSSAMYPGVALAARIIELSSNRQQIKIINQEDKMFKKLCELQPEELKYILHFYEKLEDDKFNYFFAEKCHTNL